MQSANDLRALLARIDHKGYPAYKDTRGSYDFTRYVLSIDHVQGDPFAAPSKVSVHLKGATAKFPQEYYKEKCGRIALADFLLRGFGRELSQATFQAKGSGKSGLLSVSRPGQEVLERSACEINPQNGDITVRFEVGFPANGRTINARELEKILFDYLPNCVSRSLFYAAVDAKKVEQAVFLAEDQTYIRGELEKRNLTAFVANGAILPRESGISGKPMREAVAFTSPESLLVELSLPHRGNIKGMGIPQGVTLIVGGGYHGKSTLLKALETGVYNHIAGDGREYVITEASAVKIRAEDGRSIKNVDISMFINDLPNKKDTVRFSTEDASGSTSQAANVTESIEAGTHTFLIDEDTSATNFMIRDELMQRVVAREQEPITPFIERVRELYETFKISTILVAGSCGSYFHRSDLVIQMNRYCPYEITETAKEEAKAFPLPGNPPKEAAKPHFDRVIRVNRAVREDNRLKIKTNGLDGISIGHDTIDVRYVEQLVDTEQLNLLGQLLKYAECHVFDGKKTLLEAVGILTTLLEQKGIAAIKEGSSLPGNLAMIRPQEIFAAFNRYRKL